MEILINDFSFDTTLFIWQIFATLGLLTAIWAMIVLAKDQKETLGIKLLVLVSFFIIPFFTSVFYLIHYYSKRKNRIDK